MQLRTIRQPVLALLAGAAMTLGSAAMAQTAPGKPVRIILVGDSTMAPNGGYGDALCRRLPRTDCINRGAAGRSSSSYRAEGKWDAVQALLKDGGNYAATYVLIQFGHNDQPGKPGRSTDLATEFPANLQRYATEAGAAGAVPVLVTPLARRTFEKGQLTDSLAPWAAAARTSAAATHAPLIDLHARSSAAFREMGPEGTAALSPPPKLKNGVMEPDFTHLNPAGAEAIAALMAQEVTRQLPGLAASGAQAQAGEIRYDFTSHPAPGAIAVQAGAGGTLPLYSAAAGYGFVDHTGALPARPVHTAPIRREAGGYVISEAALDPNPGSDNANNYGMAFRLKAAPGAYAIRVRTTSEADDTTVAVTGIQTSRLLKPVFWDAASLLPNRTPVTAHGRDWSYRYVNGRGYIDIEVEPNKAGVPVGLAEIVLTPIAPQARPAGVLPAIHTLGDSTVKSYTFDEAPMSGWGQVIDDLFDRSKVRVLNYSMGGRSFRNAYAEGRLNDLLLTGYAGDIVMIQFGHNDESADETRRWGRGATEAMYEEMIREVYLPAIRARGMVPVFVTPMSRVNGAQKPGEPYVNSFSKRRFPDLMKKLGAALDVPVVDLNARSVEYFNSAGPQAITAMVMSIEAGETPGKTNDGSYANGHPANKIDGTHYKEALAKQYARIVVTELARLAAGGDPVATGMAGALRPEVRRAIAGGDWTPVYPEVARDIAAGEGAYYRNQVEKLLQLGALHADAQGLFHPAALMRTREFCDALSTLMRLPAGTLSGYPDAPLTRALMGAILDDAYHARFTARPAYMTDYNGKTVVPGSPGYDPNLDSGAQGAMYYPLLRWTQLQDLGEVPAPSADKLRDAYELGLIRSEAGIARGRMVNGRLIEARAPVTRAKAAKALYFMWVLAQPPKDENDRR